MNGEVHIPIGLATAGVISLAVPLMQPHSMEMAAGVVICGSIGALTPDIDANGDSKAKQNFRKFILLLVIAIFVGKYYGVAQMPTLKGWNLIGGIGLFICYLYGYTRKHRHFTHELRGLIIFSIPSFLCLGLCNGLWFFIGMLSHQISDMCNHGKILWLYPIKKEKNFSRGWFSGSSAAAEIIGMIAWLFVLMIVNVYSKWIY